ncbi:hypothetical protein ACQPXB_27850 [Amycolatopsis sp. CA-161197]|uniref:hypothetical protein n=1 Tax=Amycolatopsis sp. CA-161197 TaxID=3239922 RepID=UPI003D8CE749
MSVEAAVTSGAVEPVEAAIKVGQARRRPGVPSFEEGDCRGCCLGVTAPGELVDRPRDAEDGGK